MTAANRCRRQHRRNRANETITQISASSGSSPLLHTHVPALPSRAQAHPTDDRLLLHTRLDVNRGQLRFR